MKENGPRCCTGLPINTDLSSIFEIKRGGFSSSALDFSS
jgi:hypothetical protein